MKSCDFTTSLQNSLCSHFISHLWSSGKTTSWLPDLCCYGGGWHEAIRAGLADCLCEHIKHSRRHRSTLLVVCSVKHNWKNMHDIKFERPTFLQLLWHVHACQVSEHQHPGFQTVRIAERRLLLLHVDISQLTDQLQNGQKRLFNDTLLDDNLNFFPLNCGQSISSSQTHTHTHTHCAFLTCGTSMLSVGRMVASLLLRGSNSNAAVNTMANPGGPKKEKIRICQKPDFVMQEVRLL